MDLGAGIANHVGLLRSRHPPSLLREEEMAADESTLDRLDAMPQSAVQAAHAAESYFDRYGAGAEFGGLDAEAARTRHALVSETHRLRAEAPEVLTAWAVRRVKSLERASQNAEGRWPPDYLSELRADNLRLRHEWRLVVEGSRGNVTLLLYGLPACPL